MDFSCFTSRDTDACLHMLPTVVPNISEINGFNGIRKLKKAAFYFYLPLPLTVDGLFKMLFLHEEEFLFRVPILI